MGHRGCVMRNNFFKKLKFGFFTEFYLENFWRPLIKLCLLCSSFVIGWIVLTYYSHYRYISCMRCNFVYRGGIFRTLGVLVCTCYYYFLFLKKEKLHIRKHIRGGRLHTETPSQNKRGRIRGLKKPMLKSPLFSIILSYLYIISARS